MYKIGLTGSIGSGKSTVTSIVEDSGYIVLDADEISREITATDRKVLDELTKAFGQDIIQEDGSLNRGKLAEIAFVDPNKKELLSQIVTQRVKEILEQEALNMEEKGLNILFMDIPLLFEYQMDKQVDEVWVVTADKDLRFERAHNRDGISKEDFDKRDNAQMSQEEKISRGDIIIENNGDVHSLLERIKYELVRVESIEPK